MNSYLFVYGTLMNNLDTEIGKFLRNNSIFKGEGLLKGLLYDLGHYPGAVYDSESENNVTGHIYQLKNENQVLPKLDEYEAVGEQYGVYNEYIRKKVPVTFKNEIIYCWAYIYIRDTENLPLIPSGNYLEVLRKSKKHQDFIKRV